MFCPLHDSLFQYKWPTTMGLLCCIVEARDWRTSQMVLGWRTKRSKGFDDIKINSF